MEIWYHRLTFQSQEMLNLITTFEFYEDLMLDILLNRDSNNTVEKIYITSLIPLEFWENGSQLEKLEGDMFIEDIEQATLFIDKETKYVLF